MLLALPVSRGLTQYDSQSLSLASIFNGDWISYSSTSDSSYHIHGGEISSGKALLTFLGTLKSSSSSLHITDMAHHHLSLGVLLIWSSHLYQSLYAWLGHRIRIISSGTCSTSYQTSSFLSRSLDLELSISLAAVSQASSYTAQHIYSLPAYAYLSTDYVTFLALYTHHSWISSFCIVGSITHGGIFIIRDYNLGSHKNSDLIYRILAHKSSIISHLSWVSLWLGFHTLLVYSHNDSVIAFGSPEKQLLIEPIYAQLIQIASGKTIYGSALLRQAWGQRLDIGTAFLPIGPSDLLAHHAIGLGLHITSLILIKGALDARGSTYQFGRTICSFFQ